MSENINPIVYMLAQKLIQDSIKLGMTTDWTVLTSFNTSCKHVDISYYKDKNHLFNMNQFIDFDDAEQNLRNFIENVGRLEREYFEQIKQN